MASSKGQEDMNLNLQSRPSSLPVSGELLEKWMGWGQSEAQQDKLALVVFHVEMGMMEAACAFYQVISFWLPTGD